MYFRDLGSATRAAVGTLLTLDVRNARLISLWINCGDAGNQVDVDLSGDGANYVLQVAFVAGNTNLALINIQVNPVTLAGPVYGIGADVSALGPFVASKLRLRVANYVAGTAEARVTALVD
jgi:hypothetical protein